MPKYADPAVYPVGTPAATDNVMTRTAAGADGNFALGNLAGIAGAAVASDQSVYLGSSGWASYSLTAAGRALSGVAGTANTFPYFSAPNVVTLGAVTATGLSVLAAANQAAARTAIQAVGTVGNESIAGAKTCTTAWRWDIGTFGSIQFANPLDQIGFIFRFGDPAGGDASMYRSDFRFSQGQMNLFVNAVAGTSAGTQGLQVTTTTVGPQVTNAMSCGSSGRVWTQVFATNTTISTSDGRLKTEPRQQSDAERKAGSALARLPAIWEWLTGDRLHAGPTVQAAMAVMEAHGLDPFAYSFICYDEWEAEAAICDEEGNELTPARDAGDRYSFRKEELLCFMVSALAAENDLQAAKIEAMDARLAAVEARA